MASPTARSAPTIPAGFDPTDPEIWAERIPTAELAALRENEPIKWIEQPDGVGGFNDGGYWAVTRHADVKEISRLDDVFSSEINTAIPRFNDDIQREQIDQQRLIMLNQDAPRHTRLRRIVSRGFTPRHILPLHDELQERAQAIAKEALAKGSGDFVVEVASELPLQAIAGLMGVPQEDRGKLFNWTNQMTGYDDPEYAEKYDPATSAMEIIAYGLQLAEMKRQNPGSDIVTTLIEADIDGEKLNDDELGFFIILLAVAGSETTRNSITQGMMAFVDHPDQWELFKKQRPETTADEVVRWATPVSSFQRTATRDYDLNGTQIKAGQRVVMFYRAANFDPEVFDNPQQFDILRDPNPHVGFGGTGAHYCIGTHLARMTVNLMFNAIADHIPDLKPLDKPDRLQSGWLNAIKRWPVDYTGKA
ncbi:steroid C26-monooxygenase [Mycobacterium novum]|uniref:Steroid C26-monooxygenase n=1 Tax=Mycobacterium novum TaxID=2492438 RepID=A0A7I7JNI6_9MYCO|nr:cytochrome P450 [Mycobacterium novum]BBX13313.1 steroid C26-monooxygenase [Mycobacterium novum]